MNKWTLYNASMEMASRLNAIFSKIFIFDVDRSPIGVNAYLNQTDVFRKSLLKGVRIYVNESANETSLKVRFHGLGMDKCNKCELKALAEVLGEGLAHSISIYENEKAIAFYLNDYLYYDNYEHCFEVTANNFEQTIRTEYPFAHHLKTEIELEWLIAQEYLLDNITSITKDGSPLFDMTTFKSRPSWGILRIEKTGYSYDISMQDCNFFSSRMFEGHVMSYISQFANMGRLPQQPLSYCSNPYMEIYLSSDSRQYFVTADRVRNYGLTPEDIKAAIPLICNKLMIRSDVEHWLNYTNLPFAY